MSLTPYPMLRLKLTMPQALKLQFLPAIPGSNASAAADRAEQAAQAAEDAANTAVAATANKVDRTGDVMSGFLTLNANPTAVLHAATKQYVDAQAGAPINAEYVVGVANATLTNERVVTNTATITWDTSTPGQIKANSTSAGVTDGDKGDITVSGSGAVWTIDNDAVTYAKIQNVSATARFLGRFSAGAGDTEEGTGTQATALLDVFTSTLKGLAPLSGGGTANFLRADGTWATPPGGGGGLSDAFQVITDGTTPASAVGAGTFKLRTSTPLTVATQNNDATNGDNALFALANTTVGDIVITGTGSTWTIGNNAVTFAKMQDIATDSLIGRDTAASGDPENITLNATLSMTGAGALQRAALTGDVTVSAGSNATTIANDAVTYAKMQNVSAASRLIGRGSASGAGDPEEITLGTNLTMTGTTLSASGGGSSAPNPPQGRLTLQTLTPVMTTTQSAKTTIFYTPYVGNQVPIYDGTSMVMTTFAELSVATTDATKSPAAIGASKVNDWFVWNDSGTVRIGHGPDWTSDTVRSAGTALAMVNGILLNNASITNGPAVQRGTYVGTTRSNASSQLDWIYGAIAANGTASFFGVWNCYNRVQLTAMVGDSGDSYTYATPAWRAAHGSTTMRHQFIVGLTVDGFFAQYNSIVGSDATNRGVVGVGVNSTTTFTGTTSFNLLTAGLPVIATCVATPLLGFNFVSAIEYGEGGTITFVGDLGLPTYVQTGLHIMLTM